MKKVIEEIFYENIQNGYFKATENEKKYINNLEKIEREFLEKINEEQKKIYEELDKIKEKLHFEQELNIFSEGFKIGLKIGKIVND